MDDTLRRKVALKSVLESAFVISLFIVGGETILECIGISTPALHIAGGNFVISNCSGDAFPKVVKTKGKPN